MTDDLEKKIVDLRGNFASTYNHLHEFVNHSIIYEFCEYWQKIAREEVKLYQEILERDLTHQEFRYIMGFRCNERLTDFYTTVATANANGEPTYSVPIYTGKEIKEFLINYYQEHDLEIKK